MRRAGDRGAVSVLAVCLVVLLLAVAGGAVEMGAALRARHMAASAADLAALAASRAAESGEDACAEAEEVARLNGAKLVTCRLDAAVATVTAEVRTPRWWGHGWSSRQSARAAPVSYLQEE